MSKSNRLYQASPVIERDAETGKISVKKPVVEKTVEEVKQSKNSSIYDLVQAMNQRHQTEISEFYNKYLKEIDTNNSSDDDLADPEESDTNTTKE